MAKEKKSPAETESDVKNAPAELPDESQPDRAEAEEVVADRAAQDVAGESLQEDTGESDAQAPDDDVADLKTDADADAADTTPEEPVEQASPPEPAAQDPAPQAVQDSGRMTGFWPGFTGGVVAAVIGIGITRLDIVEAMMPAALKRADNAQIISDLQASQARTDATLTKLDASLKALVLPDIAPVTAEVTALGAKTDAIETGVAAITPRLDALESSLSDLSDRLTTVEKKPISEGVSPEAIAAYERELTALKDATAKQRQEVEALLDTAKSSEAQAQTTAQAAANQASLTRIMAALNNGGTFSDDLAALAAAGVAIPDALQAASAGGVTTQAALIEAFPPAARDALAAARQGGSAENTSTLSWLQRQLGARSVQPRDGDDPDAILSRAEAALVNGQLKAALDEIETLPEGARDVISGWTDQARARQTALDAARSLAQSLNTN